MKVEEDPVEVEMKKKVDAIDADYQKIVDKQVEEDGKKSGFMKLIPYNKPSILILTGSLASILDGTLMPLVGIVLSKLLTYLTASWEVLEFLGRQEDPDFNGTGQEKLEMEIKFYSILMGIVAFSSGVGSATQKISFGNLGENVTEAVRRVLYTSILRKDIGWFDERENGTSVLTSAMAQDTSVINGVSTESLAPQLEGGCALLAGLIIGFVACWQMALVCLAVSPAMTIGNALGMKFS